ncbi:elongation factor P maturation arginine rhamnosyltransferase EarP [Herbaspirillum sp. alder98]|uniref:elongation factor P maturation arginine rhamnosyltransferase EarP n=1 Tax=Herbaspirillum sp. alder98 TaxID=2913096 RepID=UPI001CD836B8|nr:elongation factor P maturation arginine rhamnosyltransferase EarP [Herbaspirillum sp. alder98]MCA1322911.1 elongation factor P maturation arginine rhamnosyltransferase EarP [Herbaspirillum sp. alder98]
MFSEIRTAAGHPLRTLDLFCKVVDNYGDIGICWRLARQLTHEHGLAVRLWVDDLISFRRLCPEVDIGAGLQQVQAVTVRHWRAQDQDGDFSAADVADIVIEFFGCEIPPRYVEAMAQRAVRPLWFNLEGLSAEEWVEGCHTLPSPHRSLKLTKYFFFPGFNRKTGGLSVEADLLARRQAFLQQGEDRAFLASLGVTEQEMQGCKVSLFCYDYAPLPALFSAWQDSALPVTCLVPEGVAPAAVEQFLGTAAQAGASATRGALTLRVLPFVPQPDYDKLLWSCDLNFVRGEDSWVRGQWAGKPFIWNIYQQDKNLHHVKLNAFLKIYQPATAELIDLARAWNGAYPGEIDWTTSWTALQQDLPGLTAGARQWIDTLLANGDFMTNLLSFARRLD